MLRQSRGSTQTGNLTRSHLDPLGKGVTGGGLLRLTWWMATPPHAMMSKAAPGAKDVVAQQDAPQQNRTPVAEEEQDFLGAADAQPGLTHEADLPSGSVLLRQVRPVLEWNTLKLSLDESTDRVFESCAMLVRPVETFVGSLKLVEMIVRRCEGVGH